MDGMCDDRCKVGLKIGVRVFRCQYDSHGGIGTKVYMQKI